MDPNNYILINYALPIVAGVLVTLGVLAKTKRKPITLVATTILLLVLFGPWALAAGLVGAGIWILLAQHRQRR